MRPIKPADAVIFADKELEDEFLSLPENDWLKKALKKAIENLKYNVFYGQEIGKRLIPRIYFQKEDIDILVSTAKFLKINLFS